METHHLRIRAAWSSRTHWLHERLTQSRVVGEELPAFTRAQRSLGSHLADSQEWEMNLFTVGTSRPGKVNIIIGGTSYSSALDGGGEHKPSSDLLLIHNREIRDSENMEM